MRIFRRRPRGSLCIPGFSQGQSPSPGLERRFYGTKGGFSTSVHRTGTIDIQLDAGTGEVVAVWFRCLNLPFTVSTVSDETVCNPGGIAIESISYAQLREETPS